MFLGHFALGMAAKRVEPEVSLATAFLAAQLADIVWPVLVRAGVAAVALVGIFGGILPLAWAAWADR